MHPGDFRVSAPPAVDNVAASEMGTPTACEVYAPPEVTLLGAFSEITCGNPGGGLDTQGTHS
jgi:hypothetical protein